MSSGKWWPFCLGLNVLKWYENSDVDGDDMFLLVMTTMTTMDEDDVRLMVMMREFQSEKCIGKLYL